MAPFKLKFRMGGSRSTSSEHEGDAVVPSSSSSTTTGSIIVTNTTNTTNQGSQSVINSTTSLIHFGSTSTIDSDHNTDSLVSLGNNDQRALLQNCGQTSIDSIGYINPSLTHTEVSSQTTTTTSAASREGTTAQSTGKSKSTTATSKQIPSTPPPSYEHVLEENRLAALDKENNQTFLLHTLMQNSHTSMNSSNQQLQQQQQGDNRTYTQHDDSSMYATDLNAESEEDILCTDSNCEQNYDHQNYENQHSNGDEQSSLVGGGINECNLMVDSESIHLSDIDCQSYHDNSYHDNLYETYSSGDPHDCPDEPPIQYEPVTPQQKPGKEIIYKSSKEMYKAVAKECGITCKMSDQCRCYDCQSRYFDCEYEQNEMNENEKSDGGLGAGTPLYLSEVMHGTACTIL